MPRIGDTPNEPGKVLPGPIGPTIRPVPNTPAFVQQFEATRASAEQQTLEGLVSTVDAQARMLLRHPTPANVAAYREAIRRYLKEVTAKMGRTDKKTDRRNRTLVVIRELDGKLAELTEALLSGQLSPIALAASVNEIRGLLLDLLI